jgi:SAM-dependent methyltransferase
MEQYSGVLARFYDQYFVGLEGELDFYLQQAAECGGSVLELGCGTGRILLPTAISGVDICGLDSAPPMLAQLQQRKAALPADQASRIDLVQGEMQKFSLDRRFRLVTIPYRSFQHLLAPADQEEALHCIYQHLETGGRLAFNIFDPQGVMGPFWQGHETGLCHDTDFIEDGSGHRVVVWYLRRFDPDLQLMEQELVFDEVAKDGRVVARHHGLLNFRYTFRFEMQYLLELCGFRVDGLYGDFWGGVYRGSGEQVWLATKE